MLPIAIISYINATHGWSAKSRCTTVFNVERVEKPRPLAKVLTEELGFKGFADTILRADVVDSKLESDA